MIFDTWIQLVQIVLTQSDVPYSLDDIDASWMTEALRDSGVLIDEEVTHITRRSIGEGTGFNGEVAILSLTYSDSTINAPASVVLKIPSASKNRVIGQTMGLYEKEIRAYRDLTHSLNVRTPRLYYSALDVADDPDVTLERLEGLNRMPMWLIALFTALARFLIARTPRHYVLIMEDLSRYRMGDQLKECSAEDIQCILRSMAHLHAQFWQRDDLQDMSWLIPSTAMSKIIQMMYLKAIAKYKSANAGKLSSRQIELIDWIKTNGIALTEAFGEEPQTVLHGDMRLDNFFFDDESGEAILMDWQLVGRGAAGLDLAYFLSASVPLNASEDDINHYIEYYRKHLRDNGVEISFRRLRWQYEVAMLTMLHRILPTLYQDQMDLGDDRGPQMIQEWVDKIFRKVENIQFDNILESRPT